MANPKVDPIPVDGVPAETPPAPSLLICPNCARSLALENGKLRLATATDTKALPPDQLAALKTERTAVKQTRG